MSESPEERLTPRGHYSRYVQLNGDPPSDMTLKEQRAWLAGFDYAMHPPEKGGDVLAVTTCCGRRMYSDGSFGPIGGGL